MYFTTVFAVWLALALQAPGATLRALPFRDGGWQLSGEGTAVVREGERDVLAIRTGMAVRPDARLEDGTIDFDVRLTRQRSFVYVLFRVAGDGEHEEIYLRPHKSGLPDAVQYAPSWQGQSAWQLFHGPGATAASAFEDGAWTHVRLVIQQRSAALFLGDMSRPVLVVPRLARDPRPGSIGLKAFAPGESGAAVASYANVTIRSGYVPYAFEAAPAPSAPDGVVRAWSVSSGFVPGDPISAELPSATVLGAFSRAEALPSGLVTLDRFVTRPEGAAAVVARLQLRAAEAGTYAFDLGFSDIATVFLNRRPVMRGTASYSFDAPRRDGLIGLDQARVYLPLVAGLNELSVLVTDTFGGWGVMGRFVDGGSKLTVEVPGQEVPARRVDWQSDVDFLTAMLSRVHADAFHATTRVRFERAVAALSARLPSLGDAEARAELAALVASIGDGHTRVNLFVPGGPGTPADPAAGFVPLPITLYAFDDGLYVRSADPAEQALVGARLVAIDGVAADDAARRLERFVHHDNRMTVAQLMPSVMTRPAFVRAAGIAGPLDRLEMQFETADGRRITRVLRSEPGSRRNAVDAYQPGRSSARPLWLTETGQPYWMRPIADGRTIYVQFNVTRNSGKESLAGFAARVEAEAAHASATRLIVDLRHNDGGNFADALPLLDVLGRFDRAHGPGSLFVVIGRATFSAAGVFAALVEDRTGAIFVGEPTGASPNTYGDLDSFTLPSSGLSVSYAKRVFQPAGPYDDRPWLDPDVSVPVRFADYAAGRDPVMAAIAAWHAEPPLAPRLLAAAREGSVEHALEIYDAYMAQPEHAFHWGAADLIALGRHYWQSDALADSLRVWEQLARDYPDSPEGLENLVETYQAMGNRLAALDALFQSIAVHPDNPDAVELVRELCGAPATRFFLEIDASVLERRSELRQRCRASPEKARVQSLVRVAERTARAEPRAIRQAPPALRHSGRFHVDRRRVVAV